MKNLSWFQARNLAMEGGQAIRRSGWSYWLLYRGFLWLVSTTDASTQQEKRRVATADDFRDSEFLAKDWTDELFAGGSYPPCTTAGPATVEAANASGGTGAWTLVPGSCGGAGVGGGVVPGAGGVGVVPITATMTAYADVARTMPISHDSTSPVDFCVSIDWSIPPGQPCALYCLFNGTDFDFSTIDAPTDTSVLDEYFHLNTPPSGAGWSQTFKMPMTAGVGLTLARGGPLVVTAKLVLFAYADLAKVIGVRDLSYRLWISGS